MIRLLLPDVYWSISLLSFHSLPCFGLFLETMGIYNTLAYFLSLIQPVKDYFIFTRLDKLYFTNDWELLATDGNAVNQGIFSDYITLYMLYLVAIAAFAVFNRWVLRSTVELEKSRANYSRYFSPDVRDEIESSTQRE